MRKLNGPNTESGFSLIEMLVVITIMGALAAGTTVYIKMAGKAKAKTVTNTRLMAIASGLEQVKQAIGYYPGAYTRDLRSADGKEKVGEKVGVPNETNVGIETVYIAFNLEGVNVNMDGLDDSAMENYDEDEAGELVGRLAVPDLFEYVDYWGNPFVYLHTKDYKDPSKVEKYVRKDLQTITVAPATSAQTKQFERAQSFQLFSLGPDGEPGTDDDIHWGK